MTRRNRTRGPGLLQRLVRRPGATPGDRRAAPTTRDPDPPATTRAATSGRRIARRGGATEPHSRPATSARPHATRSATTRAAGGGILGPTRAPDRPAVPGERTCVEGRRPGASGDRMRTRRVTQVVTRRGSYRESGVGPPRGEAHTAGPTFDRRPLFPAGHAPAGTAAAERPSSAAAGAGATLNPERPVRPLLSAAAPGSAPAPL